jgi:hypothetical protein
VHPTEIAGSDNNSMARLLKALSYSSHSKEAASQKELYSAIDEYFRKKFRQISTKEALDILIPLGEDTNNKLAVLDDKFWVWETLEEAMRANVSEMNEADLLAVIKAYSANFKGSEDLWDFMMQQVHSRVARPF